jgi:hypothetical protein
MQATFIRLLRQLLLGDAHVLPTWICVGHASPADQVTVRLEGLGRVLDVTGNNVMVELRPLVVAIGFEAGTVARHLGRAPLALSLHDPLGGDRCLGRVGLEHVETLPLPGREIGLFSTTWCDNRCLPPSTIRRHYAFERIKLALDHNPRNEHKMAPRELFCNWLLFSSPRPVFLVSFDDGVRGNMFPMDLLGPTDTPYYLLALTTTDPSLPFILRSRRLAVSAIPLEYTPTAYAIGRNHAVASIAWDSLPLATTRSLEYGIPVPRDALSVRELWIDRTHRTDHHTLFLATTRRFERYHADLQMCHVQRIYQRYLIERARPLPSTDRGYRTPPPATAPGAAIT